MSRRDWHDVLMEAAQSITDRRYEMALDQLSQFLLESASEEEQSEALALRGTVRVHLGEREAAQRDLERAHALSRPGEYHRYALELLLADAARTRGSLDEARALYARALETASGGGKFSAGSALAAITAITRDVERSSTEQTLIRHAISASWHTLRLAAPIPEDVGACVRAIVDAERGGAPSRAR